MMKKFLALGLALVMAGVFAGCGNEEPEAERDLNSQTDDLAADEEVVVTEPEVIIDDSDFSGQGITDEMLAEMIESGEIPADVTRLVLNDNEISDLSPLAELTELVELNLARNFIGDLSPLAKLTKLEYLFLEQNLIEDVSPLLGLLEMQRLNLTANQVDEDDIRELLEVLQCEIMS